MTMIDTERDTGAIAAHDTAECLGAIPTERLEAEATTLAGRLAALTCRWLLVVAELDRREAWRGWECVSMAHWLSWKCGLSLVTGREHVRVARALADLPLVRERFAAGRLSFSKVRALTRIIRIPEMEESLVGLATHSTAAQLDRVAAAYGTIERLNDPEAVQRSFATRVARRDLGDDGTDTIVIRGPRDLIAEMWATFEAVTVAEVPAGDGDTIDQRRFDGVAAACRRLRQPDSSAPPPITLVLHGRAEECAAGSVLDEAAPVLLGGVAIGPPAARRLLGDAAVAVEEVRADGSVARTPATPTIPRAVRRAVRARDARTCRWPSCTHRAFLHLHHITWRSRGGAHTVRNLILLCPRHHAKVHLGGWAIEGDAAALAFVAPDGRHATESSPLPALRPGDAPDGADLVGPEVDAHSIDTALGERLDLRYTVSVFHDQEALLRRRN